MKRTKKLLSLLTALAITASSFAAMVIPASADGEVDPSAAAAPTWQIGTDGNTDGTITYEDYQNQTGALKLGDKNIYAAINPVSEGTVNFTTDVYIDTNRNFRIVLQNEAVKMYNTANAFAQVATNHTDGKVYAGPALDSNGSGTVIFDPAEKGAGWYTFSTTLDYSKKTADDFITLKVTKGTEVIAEAVKMGAIDGVDTTLKAIRLVATSNPAYFANYTVTPGSALATVTTPSTDPGGDGGDDGGESNVTAYKQDYEGANVAADWTSSNTGRYTTEVKGDATNHYLEVAAVGTGDNGTTISTNANFTGAAAPGDEFAIDFDMALTGGDNQNSTWLRVNSNANSASDYILNLQQITAGGTKYTINGYSGQTLDVAKGEWYHYHITQTSSNTFLEVTDATDNEVFKNQPIFTRTSAGGFKGITLNSGRYNVNMKIDNVEVRDMKAGDAPEGSWYNIYVNTTRYAAFTRKDNNAVFYADENGKITVPILPDETTFEYEISKTGYQTETGTVTIDGADQTINKELTSTTTSEGDNVLYYESDFGNANKAYVTAAADRLTSMPLGAIPSLPKLFTVSMKVTVDREEETAVNWVLRNSAGKDVIGIQGTSDNGLVAFTDFNGSSADQTDINQSGSPGHYGNSVTLNESGYVGTYTLSFTFNNNDDAKNITIKCVGKIGEDDVNVSTSIPLTQDPSTISSMSVGKYRTTASVTIDDVMITEPDPSYVDIVGSASVAKISGKSVTRKYVASPAVVIEGETFTWSVADSEGNDVNGVTIAQDGTLTVTDATTPGKVIITAKSDKQVEQDGEEVDKVGTLEVTIADFQKFDLSIAGPRAYQNVADAKGKYSIASAVDGLGNEVKDDIPAPVWTSSNAQVATIDQTTGELTVVGKGETTIKAAVTNNTITSEKEITVIVDNFYITGDVADNAASTEVDLANIVEADKYIVTTATDGTLVNQEVIDLNATKTTAEEAGVKITATYTGNALTSVEAPETVAAGDEIEEAAAGTKVFFWKSLASMEPAKTKTEKIYNGTKVNIDTTDAAEYEVAPVFETTMNTEVAVPVDTYNVTVTVNNADHSDVYVNNQMIFNNINQGCDSWDVTRTKAATADYTAEDVVIPEGYANFKYMDDKSGGSLVTAVAFVKAPSIVKRAKRMYVVGDSLVAKYHGDASKPEWTNLVRTGWGDVLQDYVKDVKVTNLGNSGAWASGMWNDAWTNIITSAQDGDIVVWEFGYNDTKHGGSGPMLEAAEKGRTFCSDNNIDFYIVTPNASGHDYKDSVAESAAMRTWATEKNVNLIDLSALSYKFLNEHYGTMEAAARGTLLATYYNNNKDSLHSTYNAANAWAAIVAQNLPTEYQNTEHTFTIDDGTETPITVGVGKMPTLEAASGSGE